MTIKEKLDEVDAKVDSVLMKVVTSRWTVFIVGGVIGSAIVLAVMVL